MKEIFSGNSNTANSAFINWRIEKNNNIGNMLAMAKGFMSSAIALSNLCLRDNRDKKADMLIFPIFSNINHGIELYLKSLNLILNELLGAGKKLEGGHNIQMLYQMVQSNIEKHKGKKTRNDFTEQTKELEAYLYELFALIGVSKGKDKMDFSRYPLTKDHDNHFYVDQLSNIEVDLENFVERFEKIDTTLYNISSYYLFVELRREEW